MKLSIVYVYFNTPSEIISSVKSIPTACKKNSYEIIIVDNKSTKKLPLALSKNKKIKIIKNTTNKGFGSGCNMGAAGAKGEYLLFLNPDTILSTNSVDELIKTFKEGKKIGIAGPRMMDGKKKELPTINSFINFTNALVVYSPINKLLPNNPLSKKFWLKDINRHKQQKVDVISGACMLIKNEIFVKVGGFDPRFFMYFEEQDLCFRVSKLGYKIIFNPKATITHLVGASLNDKAKIRKYFEKSRYEYMKKHSGLPKAIITEFFLRGLTVTTFLVGLAIALSLFLNIYKQNSNMLLIGDAARDFLAAREMILTGKIPIVGIPSSVVWLHQGPISVWLIGLSFLFTNFNPVAPAIFYGIIGAITTGLVWYLGKILFNERVGIVCAFLYACAPFIVVNARMPYHTSLIPFFTAIFFIILTKTLQNRKLIPFLFFSLGLLLMVELSNIVVLGVILLLFYFLKIKPKRNEILKSIVGFCLGITPFILYEFQYGPTYLKFPLWIGNRIRLFIIHGNTSAEKSLLGTTMSAMYQEITAAIIPNLAVVSLAIFLISLLLIVLRIRRGLKRNAHLILFLWLVFPICAFFLHSSPGQAYFTLLFPAIAILTGYFLYILSGANIKVITILTACIVMINSSALIGSEFYVRTASGSHLMPPTGYSLGNTWELSDEASKAIVKDANGKQFTILPDGIFKLYATSLDPYVFLTWKHGGNYVKKSNLVYVVTDKISNNTQKIIFRSSFENVIRK